jgi:O-antigen/teichoic acid export membrane protein
MVFFFPRVSRLNESKDLEQIQRYTDTAVKFSVYLLLPLVVILILASGLLVPLILGVHFAGAINIFRLWLVGVLILGVFSPYDHVLFATRNHKSIVMINLLTTLIVLGLGWQLIPVLGGVGAAVAAVSGWLIGGVWQYLVLYQKTGIKFLHNWRLSRVEVKYLYELIHSFSQAGFRSGRKKIS